MIGKLRRRLTLLVLAALLLVAAGIVLSIHFLNWHNLCAEAEEALSVLAENGGERPRKRRNETDPVTAPYDSENGHDPSGFVGEPDGAAGEKERASSDESAVPPDGEWLNEGESRGASAFRGREIRQGRQAGQPPGGSDVAASLSNYYTIWVNEENAVTEWVSERSDLYSDNQVAELAGQILLAGRTSGRIGTQFFRVVDQAGGKMLVVLDARMEIAAAQRVLLVTSLVALIAYILLSAGAVLLIRKMIAPVQDAFDRQKQFVWDASHELKTPLAVISANAEALAGEIGENESLQYIQSEVRRTDRLVQNLLTLAHMDRGTTALQKVSFDLSRALLSVALPFETTVFEAGKRMETEIPEGIRYTGDEEMIKQLAVILLSNAVKYSDEGGVITLSLEARGERRVLKVHNTGEAIAPENLSRIFDRFYRVDSSHNREVPGNGLGLAIARNIADAHRGKITVDSTPERGTAFIVTL